MSWYVRQAKMARWMTPLALLLLGTMLASTGWAQQPRRVQIPDPENLTLVTKGIPVQLVVTFFPGTKKKESVPIIMLHGWDGNRGEFAPLARYLQEQGHTVIVPDLRGHGDSIRVQGTDRTLDRERFNANDLAAMGEDIEACKRHLMERNNEGECNIEMLTVIAAEESCVLAGLWSLKDWSWPMIGGKKQGQDVKALIFLSPHRSLKNLNLNRVMRDPLFSGGGAVAPLSALIAVGAKDTKASRDATTIYENFKRRRPELELSADPQEALEQRLEQQDLYLEEYNFDIQGTRLADARNEDLYNKINGFIFYRLVRRAGDLPWLDRSR